MATHREMATHHRRRIGLILLATLACDAVGTVVIYLFENDAHGTKIHTIGDSLFWTTTQLLTVSSQLPNPISTGGRIFDVLLQFWAISLVATLAASFGGLFYHQTQHRMSESR